ncbi:MAG: (2Fe-2S)-binding protein [Candidatus Neomarinimicrobiota bacterium]
MLITFQLNGHPVKADLPPGLTLLEYLRDHRQYSVKRGCDHGECGACSVLVDDRPHNACLLLVPMLEGRNVVTLEGLEADGQVHRIQERFISEGAIQCGYCTPGMIISLAALLRENPASAESEIRTVLAGNLCRCTGYVKPVAAINRLVSEEW